jgi:hypothetical protein
MELLRGVPCAPVAVPAEVLHDQAHVPKRPDDCVRAPEPEALGKLPYESPRPFCYLG